MTYIGDFEGPELSGVDWQGGVGKWGIAKFGNDQNAIVYFHTQSVYNEVKSIHAGRRVFDEVDFVSIQHPGERDQKIDRPVVESDKRRWPSQWRAYVEQRDQIVEGTPIDLLFAGHPGIADTMKAAGVMTVEQLAGLSASAMNNIGMGAQDYVNYAKRYLDAAQRGVGFHQMQRELEQRDQQIKLLSQHVETLKKQLDALAAANSAVVASVPTLTAAPALVSNAPQQNAGNIVGLPPLPARIVASEDAPKRKVGRPRKPLVSIDQPQETGDAES